MKLNKGLNRDIDYNNQLPNTYRDANNLVLSKDGDRLESEKGSTELPDILTTVYGETIIGKIVAGDEFILFVTQTTPVTLRIYRYKNGEEELILATTQFEVDIDAPIQGEYKYNYNKELIILFYSDVDVPRILNVDNLGFDIDGTYKEFVNPNDKFLTRQYTNFTQGNILINSTKIGGNYTSGIYQFSIQYKILDDTYTNHSLLSNPIPIYKFNPKNSWYNIYAGESGEATSKGIELSLDYIDLRFTKFRLGVIYKTATSTTAYVTEDFYTNNNVVQLVDFSKLVEVSISDILVSSMYIDVLKATTTINNVLYLANYTTSEDIRYQKYACNITSEFVFDEDVALLSYSGSYKDEVVLYSDKSFMPFEIYDFYIRFIKRSDGNPTTAFHIPGRELTSSELTASTSPDDLRIYSQAKYFHFNDCSGASAGLNTMGVWQNDNTTYPDDDEYDGRYDYDGSVITAGVKLSTENTRFHRFPSLRGLAEGSFDILSSSLSAGTSALVTFGNANYNPVVFLNTTVTPNVGYFINNDTYKNNTGAAITGVVAFSFNMKSLSSGGFGLGDNISAEIHILDSGGTSIGTVGTPPAVSTTLTWSESVTGVTIPSNGSLYINIYAGDPDDSLIQFTGDNFLTYEYEGAFDIESVAGKKLGIKLSNIQIPQYIKDSCSHYEILYSERTTGETSVLAQSFIDIDNTFSSSAVKAYPFDILYNRPELGILAIRPELELSTTVVSSTTVATASTYNNIYSVLTSKYVHRDIGYTTPTNLYRQEYVYIDTYSTLLENATYTIASLLTFKPNLYSVNSNTNLVRVGKLVQIGSTGTLTTGNVYGGDVVNNAHGIQTVTGYTVLGSVEDIQYYLLPVFSVSNIGYRYTDDDPINIFFPKYNLIETYSEGTGTTYAGVVNVTTTSLAAAISSLYATEYPAPSDVKLYKLDEYYGYENVIHSINNISPVIKFNVDDDFTNEFPYRLHRSINQGTETLVEAWRKIYANDYYDSSYNRGEIIQLDHDDKDLLIEHKNALFVVRHLDELQINDNVTAALGSSDIFNNLPQEIIPTDGGYVGCQSKFASIRCPFGNIIVDRQQGKIFLYDNYKVDEINKYGLYNWFITNLQYIITDEDDGAYLFDDTTEVLFDDSTEVLHATSKEIAANYILIDNPYNNLGILCAYDRDNERLIFTKNQNEIGSSKSWTLSYYPKFKQWVSFHTYIPNTIFNNRNGIYFGNSWTNIGVYKLVDTTDYTDYYDTDEVNAVTIDVCFAQPYNVDKQALSFSWSTVVISEDVKETYDLTFDKAIVYNRNQHSDVIDLVLQTFDDGNIRNTNGQWHFNDFKDVLSDKTLKLLDPLQIDELLVSELDSSDVVTNWYDKSNFTNPYNIIRLIYNGSGYSDIVYPVSLATNSGYNGTTDWVDTNSDGIADDWDIWGNAALTTASIVTGNGFTGNAQRVYAVNPIGLNYIFFDSPIIERYTSYRVSFKYRASETCNIILKLNGGSVWVKWYTLAANTGDAIEVIITCKVGFNHITYTTSYIGFGFYYAYAANNWMEIDEVCVSECIGTTPVTPSVGKPDKIIINDISNTAVLKGRI